MRLEAARGTSALVLVLLTAGAACKPAGSSTVKPEAVLLAYADALEAGQVERAYDLLSEAARKKITRGEFAAMLRESGSEAVAVARELRGRAQRVQIEAHVTYGDGDAMSLVVENGGWRLASSPVDLYGQRTPAEALRSFVRAIERKRYDIVLRFVPAKWAESMTVEKLKKEWEGSHRSEVETLLKTLRANFNSPIQQNGNTAVMPYGEKNEVRFVREDGLWKVEDPD
jgi:hypothetical protein